MSYFEEQYSAISFPPAGDAKQGLRKAQIGAIFAVGSHFTIRKEPAIAVMPTGSGKTAVLTIIPFIRRSKRVLIITTSRLVRDQISEDVAGLVTLKHLGVVSEDTQPPKTHELTGRVQSAAAWETLREFDVVVATPNSVSPGLEGIPELPKELFDLLLVDEAHHSAAKSWKDVLDAFPDAEKVLFTATPFRRDDKEIKGRLVYVYPLKAAYDDKIFGTIRYIPVSPKPKESSDVAIALSAQATMKADKAAGFQHALMVRTDSKLRAKELKARPYEVKFQRNSPELACTVIVTNEQQKPKWTKLTIFNRSEYDLFIVYYHKPSKLLFINASRRSDDLYDHIADCYSGGKHTILPLCKINRVLRDVEKAEYFNVGMKNRVQSSNTESYRIVTGPRAHRSVAKSDGRMFHRGHIFGKGTYKGETITIGYSSASKIWSNQNKQIPVLIQWCKGLAESILSNSPMPSQPGLDYLTVGELVKKLPDNVIAAEWHESAYKQHVAVDYVDVNGETRTCEITELELNVDRTNTTEEAIRLLVVGDGLKYPISFSLKGNKYFEVVDDKLSPITIQRGVNNVSLINYLNNEPLRPPGYERLIA